MSSNAKTRTVLPAQQAVVLGEELKRLNADDGPRLQQIIWQLRGEVRKQPDDLDASTALTLALSLAGFAEDAQEEAVRSAKILAGELGRSERPPLWLHLNVVSALINAGLESAAKQCIAVMNHDNLDREERNRFLMACVLLAIRFGDLLLESCVLPPVLFMQRHDLVSRWAEQQKRIEETLRPHVAYFDYAMARLDDGSTEPDRLVLTYNTDLESASELDELEAKLWDVLEDVYKDRPNGAGFLIGKVLFDLAGPRIPLEDPKP